MKVFKLKRKVDSILLKNHIKSLSSADKYLRFGYPVHDETVDKYVDSTFNQRNHIWFGVANDSKIIATSHVVLDSSQSLSEFGLTVDENYRNKGIAKLLFGVGLDLCREHKIRKILLFCLAQNIAMRHIAKHFGLTSSRSESDITAHVDLTYD